MLRGGYCLSTIRGHIEQQLEQLLQQVTTLRGDIASSRPMQTKGCLLRNNNIQRFALDNQQEMAMAKTCYSMVSFLAMITVSDLLSVRCGRRQQRDRR